MMPRSSCLTLVFLSTHSSQLSVGLFRFCFGLTGSSTVPFGLSLIPVGDAVALIAPFSIALLYCPCGSAEGPEDAGVGGVVRPNCAKGRGVSTFAISSQQGHIAASAVAAQTRGSGLTGQMQAAAQTLVDGQIVIHTSRADLLQVALFP